MRTRDLIERSRVALAQWLGVPQVPPAPPSQPGHQRRSTGRPCAYHTVCRDRADAGPRRGRCAGRSVFAYRFA